MPQPLISHSPDLTQLRDEGYDIEVRAGHLLVKGVPYVNGRREVRRGTLVTPLGEVSGDITRPPGDHTAYARRPHGVLRRGAPVPSGWVADRADQALERDAGPRPGRRGQPQVLGEAEAGREVSRLSPQDGHVRGARLRPARSIDPMATAQTCVVAEPPEEDSPFRYLDTASTRTGIGAVTAKLEGQAVAIVGIGGTGSYMLDLVAKTPVREIHIFDGGVFSNRNAFRSPGAPSLEELKARPLKASRRPVLENAPGGGRPRLLP